ncbi:bifunctional diguanylate cyclase/phosphodiesterase [Pararhizobium sp. IMCC21322]|uniref:putative bifunctional diguanylate cyclase/phosphodiesterase n=1 Tax=Pararhizobium sp. IMCC21322 TaxID=3067903 RepID=UPI0027419034|nr:EAL domain-containing protein [Pararhizobium sp. IMCC21322]
MKSPTSMTTPQTAPGMVQFSTLMALLVAIFIAVFPPLLHYYYSAQLERGQIESEAKLHAKTLSQLIGRNPALWQFETLRINELIEVDHLAHKIEVKNADAETVTQTGVDNVLKPYVSVTQPLHDAGREVGYLVVTHSLLKVANSSALLLLVTLIIAFGAFFFLRTFPLNLLRRASEQSSFLASHDPLTNLPNRSVFNEWLLHSIGDADRQKTSLAVLCIDLDHFKEVNDILGHAAGDRLLKQAAERMTSSLRGNDVLSRLGGDEFAIIQKHADQPSGSSALAERLIAAFSEPFDLDGNEVMTGVSIGISLRTAGNEIDGQAMLRHADQALYKAKSGERGTYQYFEEEMNDALLTRKKIQTSLRTAILEDEFELHYQPQIDLATTTIKGVEALLRWNHKKDGPISTEKFIPLAEECGLIVPIGDWVIRRACREARNWPELTFAVNVSPVQFRHGNLVATVRNALEAEDINPARLEIEITEGVLLSDTDETISVLTELQALGVRIAMDDFGTGYSSLSYLRCFPFDKIKIDKSFTQDLGSSSEADSIIEAVINLGASMGMTTNAEGVETIEQATLLKNLGCKEVQGFHFSRPVPSAAISELLADWEWSKYEDGKSIGFHSQKRRRA